MAKSASDYDLSKVEIAIAEWKFRGGKRVKKLKTLLEELNLDDNRYYKIIAKPEFQAYCNMLADTLMKSSKAEVMRSVVDNAIDGTTADRKLYLELMNEYVAKIEITSIEKEIEAMSNEELTQIALSQEKDE